MEASDSFELAPAPPAIADSTHFDLSADWDEFELVVSWTAGDPPRGICGSIFRWNTTTSRWWEEGSDPWWSVATSRRSGEGATVFVDPTAEDYEPSGCVDLELVEPGPDFVKLAPEMLDYDALIYCHGPKYGCETIPMP